MKPTKNSVALVIYNTDRSKIIIVRRPANDDTLPNIWGLPAGSLKEAETFEAAAVRSAQDKLGVEIKIIKLVGEGELEREQNILHMKEFEAEIVNGIPSVPQIIPGITQYSEWRQGTSEDLVDAAQKGSLCSRLYLKSIKQNW